MTETAYVAAFQVYYYLQTITNSLETIGSVPKLTSEDTTVEQKQELLNGYLEHYGWESLHITDEKGNVVDSTAYVGDADYFKESLAEGATEQTTTVECSATSEELAAQAQSMESLVSKFQLPEI